MRIPAQARMAVVLLVLWGCHRDSSSTAPAPAPFDAAPTISLPPATDSGAFVLNPTNRQGVGDTPPAEARFPPVPASVACTAATVETDCALPRPECGMFCADATCDPSSPWLRFLDAPRCDNGVCAWEQHYFRCFGTCTQGACRGPLSTAIP